MRAGGAGHGERGSATVLTVAGIGVVLTLAAAALVVTGVVRDVHRARGAADLAALSAASPLTAGAPAGCAAAGRVAAANGAGLTGCAVLADGAVAVTVSVTRSTPAGWLAGPSVVSARARAGVVED
ncbi:MAG TPA: Rv3654c family TadE-like protein [Actinotalea sp.]|nr:Rv3654c family TadE-like protein [Actinotalea sp.]